MKHLVIYLHNLLPPELRVLEPIFGRRERITDVLPVVSPPLDDEQLADTLAKFGDYGVAMIQPPESELPQMALDEALELVRAHRAWAELVRHFRTHTENVAIHAKEFPRCWLILAQAAPVGIPPGEGYVIDKFSGTVFPHRYIDVGHHLNVFDDVLTE
jgi:hypothetical protein